MLSTPNTTLTGISGVVDRQNYLVDVALSDGYDYLWIVQADVEVPRHAFGYLYWTAADLAYGLVERHDEEDFIAGLIDHKKKVWYLPRFLVSGHVLRGRAFAGCSCMLIKRKVLEKARFHFSSSENVGEDVSFAYDVAVAEFTSAINGAVDCGHLPEKPLSARGVLDVGCGHYPEGSVNVDLYRKASAHRSADQSKVEDWDLEVEKIPNFVQADGRVLPFPDGTFDHVISNQCIEHIADAEVFLTELLRVSRYTVEISCPDPDGPLAVGPGKSLHVRRLTPEWYRGELKDRAVVACTVDKVKSWLTAKILKFPKPNAVIH